MPGVDAILAAAFAVFLTALIVALLWPMVVPSAHRAPVTLTATGKHWITALEGIALIVLLAGVVAEFGVRLLRKPYEGVGALLGVAGSFVLTMVSHFCFYNLVRCPVCGKKLNKYKNGRNVPIKNAYTALQKGTGCKWCGWKPPASTEQTLSHV